jgi:outer membrane beta-barrel protein
VVQSHSHSTRIVGLFVFVALLVSLSPAMAQQPAPAAPEAANPAAPGAAAEQAPQEEIDPNDPLFWAKTRDIFTVQKRPFQKQGRFAATIYGGIIPNNIFEQYYPVGLRLNYFILENIGLELAASYAFTVDTGLSDTIQSLDDDVPEPLIGDTQVFHSNFGVVWSPFYGKTSFNNTVLNYFDLYLFGGAGLVITETQPDYGEPVSTATKPEGVLGAGLSFYLGDHATIRADYRQFIFQKVTGGVANPSEVSLGLGWFF